ncbi:hypothetical protein AKJ09_09953 [Labilithrix luteola]|uniref:Uncharacterized protein n=1 Tax=Labilithrix luteola TaxID=1391654 RepID=A0A0K1QCZ7_9BACT|nr:hypothetical protein [Labilithrix luteola]AKV03290.1 hypothetical protein AKJ09_09953 [Labilithrix luteola]
MSNEPFERDELVDKPGIVGARWWHASLADEQAKIARRTALRGVLIAGGAIAGLGALLAMCVKATSSKDGAEVTDARNAALEMQREYGWNFGAVGEPLVFDGTSEKPFDPSALPRLADDLRPAQAELAPYYQATLFQAPYAMPSSIGKLPPEESAGFKPLAEALKPIATPSMESAYARGKSLASLFAALAERGGKTTDANTAVIVDLPGPEAVAFAAGAAGVFDPVFLFENWPHPRGVVRTQEALAAAAYYQPLFQKERARLRMPAPAMFVLDRRRLANYTDEATQFDNRYVAKLPAAANIKSALHAVHLLYVVPTRADATRELDDLNDDFLSYDRAGIEVRSLSLDTFSQSTQKPDGGAPADQMIGESANTYYGGSPESHYSFFVDYPWAKSPRPATLRVSSNPGASYVPSPRASAYSTGVPGGGVTRPRPPNFGTVPIVLALGTGVILGARYSRSGSWNRASGGYGG